MKACYIKLGDVLFETGNFTLFTDANTNKRSNIPNGILVISNKNERSFGNAGTKMMIGLHGGKIVYLVYHPESVFGNSPELYYRILR